jgi:hypothetical protein
MSLGADRGETRFDTYLVMMKIVILIIMTMMLIMMVIIKTAATHISHTRIKPLPPDAA